jgi:hypothetical protein
MNKLVKNFIFIFTLRKANPILISVKNGIKLSDKSVAEHKQRSSGIRHIQNHKRRGTHFRIMKNYVLFWSQAELHTTHQELYVGQITQIFTVYVQFR